MNEQLIKKVVLSGGDLTSLTADEKYDYIKLMADRVGLGDEIAALKILKIDGREVLYADKGTAEILRKKHGLSCTEPKYEKDGDILYCTIGITDGKRTDYECGAVSLSSSSNEDKANARMACLTKAKRRATLSFCGLGMIDESEFDTIQGKISTAVVSDNGLQVSDKKVEAGKKMGDEAKKLNSAPEPTPDTDWLIADINTTPPKELAERLAKWCEQKTNNKAEDLFNDTHKRTAKTVKAYLLAIHAGNFEKHLAEVMPDFKPSPKVTVKNRPVVEFTEPGTDGRNMIERMKLSELFAGREEKVLELYPDLFTDIEGFYKFATIEQINYAL